MPGRRVRPAKDELLNELAEHHNVAQFVSFGAGSNPALRFARLRRISSTTTLTSVDEAVEALLQRAPEAAVNVRTFSPRSPKGHPFHYGIRSATKAAEIVRASAAEGLYSIVNELIDVEDGGVSGVALAGVVEFTPFDTPRGVERGGTTALTQQLGVDLLATVYGFQPALDFPPSDRVEFSLHPLRRGLRNEHTIIWEIEKVDAMPLTAALRWPNRFSRLLGDKAFGLLIASTLGLRVPRTTVVGRTLGPFTFGVATGSGETWLRTAPTEPVPGHFTTQKGWTDPFSLLETEDPSGQLASVLSQEGVDAIYSGALLPGPGGEPVVEGVAGFGDDFMLGREGPIELPPAVVADATEAAHRAFGAVGPVRIEWAHDGRRLWTVQLNPASGTVAEAVFSPGEAASWRPFNAEDGLEALRDLVKDLQPDEGVLVAGNVGLTSHIGDVLRRAGVPGRLRRT